MTTIRTIRTLAQDRTLLIVTHRPVELAALDRIVVIENGRVVETGDYETLMAAGGRLTAMLDAIW